MSLPKRGAVQSQCMAQLHQLLWFWFLKHIFMTSLYDSVTSCPEEAGLKMGAF